MLHNFDWLIFHSFLQLIFSLTPLTSAANSNQKIVNQKLCNTVLILDALNNTFLSWLVQQMYFNGFLLPLISYTFSQCKVKKLVKLWWVGYSPLVFNFQVINYKHNHSIVCKNHIKHSWDLHSCTFTSLLIGIFDCLKKNSKFKFAWTYPMALVNALVFLPTGRK